MYGTAKEKSIGIKKCAFCKYWYDPCNSTIEPLKNNSKYWKYIVGERKLCRKRNYEMSSHSYCSNFECKL